MVLEHLSFSTLVSLIEEGGNRRGCSHRPMFNRTGCSCRLFFNKKRLLVERGMYVGSLSIEKEYVNSLYVLQNFTTGRKSGNILSAYY